MNNAQKRDLVQYCELMSLEKSIFKHILGATNYQIKAAITSLEQINISVDGHQKRDLVQDG